MNVRQIVVIPVIGDPESARTELAEIFKGNMCLVRASRSLAELAEAQQALTNLMSHEENAISLIGSGAFDRPIELRMLMLSESLLGKLQAIGIDLINPRPSIIPVD